MQNIVDRGRVPLNDDGKVRFTDPQLLSFGVDGIYVLRQKRPDLFFGQFAALPRELAVGDPFPLPEEYAPAVQDYITARAETRNSEADLEQRASAFFALFKGEGID